MFSVRVALLSIFKMLPHIRGIAPPVIGVPERGADEEAANKGDHKRELTCFSHFSSPLSHGDMYSTPSPGKSVDKQSPKICS
jgi:hypothetical protein